MRKDVNTVCGFIGLGSQGAPIARRIIDAGYPVVLWARREHTLDQFRSTAAAFAANVADLGSRAEHVGICVIDDAAVTEVCDRLIPAMRPGGRIAIHSTIHPKTCIAVALAAVARNLVVIDAPVSGGAPAAEAGALTLMAGGPSDAIAEARPIFETFARLIVQLGDVGSAQMAKLINNTLMAANLALAHNAIDVGAELGLDRKALGEILKAGSGRSFALEVYTRATISGAFTHDAALLGKVRLLGDLMGNNNPAFVALRDAAVPFLESVRLQRSR